MKTLTFTVLLFAAIAILPIFAFGADISDFPEANVWTALDAPGEQDIWSRPGNMVLEAMSWPISRVTISIYNDKLSKNAEDGGFLTITHWNDDRNESVTFYYNIRLTPEKRSVLSFAVDTMWENGFLNITPKTARPADQFGNMPVPARLLWIMPPVFGHLTKDGGGNYLSIIAGGPAINGLITLPLTKNVQQFVHSIKGRTLNIWAAEVAGPGIDSIKWSTGDRKGQFEWKPGMKEPVFQPEKVWM